MPITQVSRDVHDIALTLLLSSTLISTFQVWLWIKWYIIFIFLKIIRSDWLIFCQNAIISKSPLRRFNLRDLETSAISQFGDICCYVHQQGLSLAIVKKHRTVPSSFITYKGLNLLNHKSQVVCCNTFVAVKLGQLRDICVKVEVAGKNDVFISRFPNLVERN